MDSIYFMGDILEHNEKRLDGHRQAQAYVFKDKKGGYGLTSYNTQILHVNHEGWLVVSGLYSMTTRKHIGWFCAQYNLPHYMSIKKVYEGENALNVFTGEIRPMTKDEKTWARTQVRQTRFYW